MHALLAVLAIIPLGWAMPYQSVPGPVPPTKLPLRAVAILRDFDDSEDEAVEGVIVFTQNTLNGPILIEGDISGLSMGFHGFHIHQLGNLTEGCKSAGSHFNPDGTNHGGPSHYYRHAGDLGNIKANQHGEAKFTMTDEKIDLLGRNSIIGRSVVVHAGSDDLGLGGDEESLKTGNAGGRVACAVIALAHEAPASRQPYSPRGGPSLPSSPYSGYLGLGAEEMQMPSPYNYPFGSSYGARNPFLPRGSLYSNPFSYSPFWGFKRRH